MWRRHSCLPGRDESSPKFPISMSEKWLIAWEIGRPATVAYWVR